MSGLQYTSSAVLTPHVCQELAATYEALQGIKERFLMLFHYSNSLGVVEFLAKYNKTKYGRLISTNTIQDPLESFYWPEWQELLPGDSPPPSPTARRGSTTSPSASRVSTTSPPPASRVSTTSPPASRASSSSPKARQA